MEYKSYLAPFLNVFYYFLLVPYKIEFDKNSDSDGKLTLKTFRFQKLLCCLTYIIVLTSFLYFSVVGVIELLQTPFGDPDIIAELLSKVSIISALFVVLSSFNIIWNRQEFLIKIIESGREKETTEDLFLETCNSKHTYLVSLVTIACVLSLIASITYPLWFPLDEESFELEVGRTFTFKSDSNLLTCISGPTIYIVSSAFTQVAYILGTGLLLCTTLELGQCVKVLNPFIKESAWQPIGHAVGIGIEKYAKLTKIIDITRNQMGDLLCHVCVSTVSYYAQAPYVWHGQNNHGNAEKVVLIISLSTMIAWIVAAEFHCKVQNMFATWIASLMIDRRLDEQNMLKLMYVSHELSTKPVAISCKYFCITYAYLSLMLGAIFTYAVVVFQLNQHTCNGNCTVI